MESKNKILDIDIKGITPFINSRELELSLSKALEAFDTLTTRKGRGNDYLGWLDLPTDNNRPEQDAMKKIAAEWKLKAQVVVVIGIGGSYLGSKAALEALLHPFANELALNQGPKILFAGQNLSQDYMAELMDLLEEKEYAAIVISKSGTTTEPAIAFRIIKNHLETKYGKEEAATRVIAVTDKSRGALKEVASKEGYRTFVIPDDVGGRYSVLTPVGLLPMAVAGVNIDSMIQGAAKMREICMERSGNNIAIQYAALRNLLYGKGKTIEILVNFNPKLQYFAEWWKQLFGESEGKVRESLHGNLLGMAGATHNSNPGKRDIVVLVEILGNGYVVNRDNPFDCTYYKLVIQRNSNFGCFGEKVCRGNTKNQHIGLCNYFIDIGAEKNPVWIEFGRREVVWIVVGNFHLLYHLIVPNIPCDPLLVIHQ